MTNKELKILADLLYIMADECAGHVCNDLPNDFWREWTKEERQQLVKEFHDYNGDPEEYDPDFLEIPDYALLSFFRKKILKNIE